MVQDKSKPVTVSILRKARPGHAAALEEKVTAILKSAEVADGHVGSGVVRGVLAGAPYINVLLHFVSRSRLDSWRDAPATQALIADALDHVVERPAVSFAEGETGWFDLPSTPMSVVPPKWKMCIVSWLAIFPLLSIVLIGTAPMLHDVPMVLRLFLNTLIMAPLMTWVVMPRMTRMFRKWLFAAPQPDGL